MKQKLREDLESYVSGRALRQLGPSAQNVVRRLMWEIDPLDSMELIYLEKLVKEDIGQALALDDVSYLEKFNY